MGRGWLTISSLVAAIVFARAFELQSAERPNVLLIAVDDMNNNLGCYGHQMVKSPHIDSLARRGVRFDRAYCQYPLCNPSRVSMLSGLRPDTTRIMDLQTPPRTYLKDVVFLPQYFRAHGYHASHIGKIFHTGPDFEDPPSWDEEIRETGKSPPRPAVIRSKRVERPDKYGFEWDVLNTPDGETADGVVAGQASDALKRLSAGGKPFFLAVGFRRPHAPYAAPKKYFDLYPVESIAPIEEPPAHLSAIPAAAFTHPVGTPPMPALDRQEAVAAYYACITFVDAQIGVVLSALDKLDLWKNTVVVFYSDHGYHLGEHGGLWHKLSIFEPSARVPLVVATPGIAGAGRNCTRLVELVDIYPTLVDLCGLPPLSQLQGRSLRPLLDDPTRRWAEAAYSQVLRGKIMGRSVRTERWRYTEWDEGRHGEQLYDHEADPNEFVNMANEPKWSEVKSHLQKLLRENAKTTAVN